MARRRERGSSPGLRPERAAPNRLRVPARRISRAAPGRPAASYSLPSTSNASSRIPLRRGGGSSPVTTPGGNGPVVRFSGTRRSGLSRYAIAHRIARHSAIPALRRVVVLDDPGQELVSGPMLRAQSVGRPLMPREDKISRARARRTSGDFSEPMIGRHVDATARAAPGPDDRHRAREQSVCDGGSKPIRASCRGDHLRRGRLPRRERRRERISSRKRRRDLRSRGGPSRRLLLEAAQDHALDDRVEARRDRRGRRRRVLGVLSPQLRQRRAVEGLPTRVELVENEAEGVDVAP